MNTKWCNTLIRLGLVYLFLVLVSSGGQAQFREPAARDLFEAYRQRQFDAFERRLLLVQDFGALRKQVAREGRDWPPEIKAAFVLEIANAAVQRGSRPNRTDPAFGLFEDACQMVRRLPPSGEFERAWHALALSMLSGSNATLFRVDDHLGHIRGRYDEGQMALMRARPDERVSWHEAIVVQPTLAGRAEHEMEFTFRSRLGRAGMRDAVELLEAARRHESVRAEATLRQAALLSTWGQHVEALPLLEVIEGLPSDAWQRYMARLFAGRSLEAVGRSGDAQALYRSAVDVQENGKAARFALAALVFSEGRREEADRLVTDALSGGSGGADPWTEFLDGDFRFLDARRSAMREHIR